MLEETWEECEKAMRFGMAWIWRAAQLKFPYHKVRLIAVDCPTLYLGTYLRRSVPPAKKKIERNKILPSVQCHHCYRIKS